MKRLAVYLEMQGQFRSAGFITGENFRDASFQYSEDYLKADYARPISISLPLTDEAFTSIDAASEAGITERIAMKIFDEAADDFENALSRAAEKLMDTGISGVKELKSKILENGGYRNI